MADALGRLRGLDPAVVDPPRPLSQVCPVPAEASSQGRLRQRRQVTDVLDPVVDQRLLHLWPDPPEASNGERSEERGFPTGRDDDEGIGLAERSEATLAHSLLVATPTLTTSPTSSRIRRLIRRPIVSLSPNAAALAVTSRNASSRLIGSTSGVTDAKIAMTLRLSSRYRSGRTSRKTPPGQRRAAVRSGMAEWTPKRRLVGGSADHAALVTATADDHRSADEPRIVEHLDRRVERVEIGMQNRAHESTRACG